MTKDTKFSTDKQPEQRRDPNPGGAANARRHIMTDALFLALNREATDIVDEDGKPTKRLNQIAEQLAKKAGEGDTPSIKEVFDRTEGKAAQALILQGDEDKPIRTIERIIVETTNQDG